MDAAYRSYLKDQEDIKDNAKSLMTYNDSKKWLNISKTKNYLKGLLYGGLFFIQPI